jgi:SNF2 family DNA or RNA helicase
VVGVNWLINAYLLGRDVILADEMGLGKTVQVVTLFEHLRSVEGKAGPFLVIVPLSTLSHWKRCVVQL